MWRLTDGIAMTAPAPTSLNIRKKTAQLVLVYQNGEQYSLSFELLRVYSPSAEVRGHSGEQAVLQTGKAGVQIEQIKPAGNYGIQIYFDDGHSSGIYSWPYLHELAINQAALWENYLQQLHKAGKSRYAGAVEIMDLKKKTE